MRALTPEKPTAAALSTDAIEEDQQSTLDPVLDNREGAVSNEIVTETDPDPDLKLITNLVGKPKENSVENRQQIPGLPEIDRKKAEQARKKKNKKEAKKNHFDEFDFTDCDECDAAETPKKSFSDLKSVFDNGKRKTTSPAESINVKKPKALVK